MKIGVFLLFVSFFSNQGLATFGDGRDDLHCSVSKIDAYLASDNDNEEGNEDKGNDKEQKLHTVAKLGLSLAGIACIAFLAHRLKAREADADEPPSDEGMPSGVQPADRSPLNTNVDPDNATKSGEQSGFPLNNASHNLSTSLKSVYKSQRNDTTIPSSAPVLKAREAGVGESSLAEDVSSGSPPADRSPLNTNVDPGNITEWDEQPGFPLNNASHNLSASLESVYERDRNDIAVPSSAPVLKAGESGINEPPSDEGMPSGVQPADRSPLNTNVDSDNVTKSDEQPGFPLNTTFSSSSTSIYKDHRNNDEVVRPPVHDSDSNSFLDRSFGQGMTSLHHGTSTRSSILNTFNHATGSKPSGQGYNSSNLGDDDYEEDEQQTFLDNLGHERLSADVIRQDLRGSFRVIASGKLFKSLGPKTVSSLEFLTQDIEGARDRKEFERILELCKRYDEETPFEIVFQDLLDNDKQNFIRIFQDLEDSIQALKLLSDLGHKHLSVDEIRQGPRDSFRVIVRGKLFQGLGINKVSSLRDLIHYVKGSSSRKEFAKILLSLERKNGNSISELDFQRLSAQNKLRFISLFQNLERNKLKS